MALGALGLALAATAAMAAEETGAENLAARVQRRKPVAAANVSAAGLLAVANRMSGSVSLVDLERGRVVFEQRVARSLADLISLENNRLLALDDAAEALLVLEWGEDRFRTVGSAPVGANAVRVRASTTGRWVAVAGLWSRQVRIFGWPEEKARVGPALRHVVALPFAVREILPLPDGENLLVADAFGGELALVDVTRGQVGRRFAVAGHNLGGLALAAGAGESLGETRVHVTHSLLDERSPTTREILTRGTLMAAQVRTLPLSSEVLSRAEPVAGWLRPLGVLDRGAADPEGIIALPENRLAVALAGNNEVAVVDWERNEVTARLPAGRRPRQLVRVDQRLVAINELDDSLTVYELPNLTATAARRVSLGSSPPPSSVERGERLFFSAHLSADGWMTCHSCHTQGHTAGLLADTRGDGTTGTPKRILTLRGTGLTDLWSWNGSQRTLNDQALQSLASTMHAAEVVPDDVYDLAAFVQSLPFPPPYQPARNEADRRQIERGRLVFERQQCGECHVAPLAYTSHATYEVGLADEAGAKKFNPPSLRGVGYHTGYFHDKRAAQLEHVFSEQAHQLRRDLSAEEQAALVRFLRSL